jgi:exopolysaccharide biosynthesis polyprenyl glycosylphosphotransferase
MVTVDTVVGSAGALVRALTALVHHINLNSARTVSLLSPALLAAIVARPEIQPAATQAPEPIRVVADVAAAPQRRRALIVGAGRVGHALAKCLDESGRFEIVGFVDEDPTISLRGHWPLLGHRDDTERLIESENIDEVFLAYVPAWQYELAERLTFAESKVGINVVPSPYEALLRTGRMSHVGEIAVVSLNGQPLPHTRIAKKMFDVVAASVFLILSSPISLLAALLIRLTSPGPVVFAQERVGHNGQVFRMFKFRSMVVSAEDATGPIKSPGKNDDRLTPIGRWLRHFRIDEIPQFWNVLKGEMSMVGPRPERPVFVDQYTMETPTYRRRHDVLPGITGLAQVCGDYHTHPRDKLRFDLYYVSHQSFLLDLIILWRTVRVVLFPERSKIDLSNAPFN